jgi:uncharacterized protein
MNTTSRKTFQGGDVRLDSLSRYDSWQLVTQAASSDGVARVVWSGPDGPAIVPVNYTVADGFIWFQTTEGSRLARECSGQQVLVEVDQVDPASHTGWSVVVTGVATCLPSAADPGLLSNLVVWPSGPRQVLLRVEPDEVTGRRLRRRA